MLSRPCLSSAAPVFECVVALGLDRPNEFGVQAVPASIGDEMPDQIATGQGQVADHVEQLVADAFVGEAKLVVDRPVGAKNQQIGKSGSMPEPLRPEPFGLFLKQKVRPGRVRAQNVSGETITCWL